MAQKETVWQRIRDALRDEIVSGAVEQGTRLPSENALAERFGVNRHTLRRALGALAEDGLVEVRRGSGAWVMPLGALEGPARSEFNLLDLSLIDGERIVSVSTGEAGGMTRGRLGLRKGARIITVETVVGAADRAPALYRRVRIPLARFPDLAATLEGSKGLRPALAQYGVVELRRAWTRVLAVSAGKRVASRLGRRPGTPALRVEGVDLDMAGQATCYAVAFLPAERASVRFEPRDPLSAALAPPRRP